jgi:hypothetical protein
MKLKVKKAGFGSIVNIFKDLIGQVSNNGVIGGDSSAWSADKMEGLRKYAPGSYGSGKQTGQQTAKASKGKFIVGKGSDYIKDLL